LAQISITQKQKGREMNRKTFIRKFSMLFCSVTIAGISNVSAQPPQNTLTLDIDKATYKVNKEIYGALLEQTSSTIYNGLYIGTNSSVPNINGMRKDVIAAFKECGVTNLDWPGGCEAEVYKWKDGIGAKTSRPGGEMSNGMGTHEYFQLCDSIGSIPYVTANVRTQSTAYMAEWLNYIETNFPGKLKYWKMGNEPWSGCVSLGSRDPEMKNVLTPTQYANKYKSYEVAIPANLKGKFFRVADGGTGNGTAVRYWLDTLMANIVNQVDAVTLHYYAGFGSSNTSESYNFDVTSYYNRLSSAWQIENLVASMENTMLKYDPNNNVGILVDEWGLWYSMVAGKNYTQSTIRDAIAASLHLNVFNNHCKRVKGAAVAQPVNFIQPLVLTEAPSQNRIVKTPTFYVYKMYKVHQDAKMVPTTIKTALNSNIPLVNASSSIDSTGKLHISMCNTHPTLDMDVTATLNNGPAYKKCTGSIINGDEFTSYNDFGVAERVNIKDFTGATLSDKTISVKLPKHSVVTLELIPDLVDIQGKQIGAPKTNFNISASENGLLCLDYHATGSTPVEISLYNLDGRCVLSSYKRIVKNGKGSFVWKPDGIIGSKLYVIKTSFGNVTKSQQILFSN
jgi:alpha-N-arabinofuranosidase